MATKDIKPRTETGLTRREVLGKALRTGAGAVASSALDTSVLGGLTDLVTSASPEVSMVSLIKDLASINNKLKNIVFNPPIGWNYVSGEESEGIDYMDLYPYKTLKSEKGWRPYQTIILEKSTDQLELNRDVSIAETIEVMVEKIKNEINLGIISKDQIDLDKFKEWSSNISKLSNQYHDKLNRIEYDLDEKLGPDVTDRVLRGKHYDFKILLDDVGSHLEGEKQWLAQESVINDPDRKKNKDKFYKMLVEAPIINDLSDIVREAKEVEKKIELDSQGIDKDLYELRTEHEEAIEKEMEDFDEFLLGAPEKDKGEELVKSLATTAGGEVLKRGLQHLATKKLPLPKPAQPKIPAPRATMQPPPEQGRGLSNIARMLPAVGKRLPFVAPAAALLRSRPAGVDADIVPPDPLGTGRVYRNYHDYNPRNI